MEYAAGGDMEIRIQKKGAFTDLEGKIIFAQLVAAINHLVGLFYKTGITQSPGRREKTCTSNDDIVYQIELNTW